MKSEGWMRGGLLRGQRVFLAQRLFKPNLSAQIVELLYPLL